MKATTVLLLMLPVGCAAADYPEARISNGVLQVKLLLPDAHQGYYRGTRFDWSGAISSLQFQGHEYFGKWFDAYDPRIHDAIMGPVEEFLTNGVGLGYEEAKPGESFVKIGVGAVRKPEEPAFRQFGTYEITDNGKWTIRKGANSVEFTQKLSDTRGYAYVYQKTVRLLPGKPEMALEHSLRNTGRKPISTSVYEHNFFMLDHQPTGPAYTVRFPFEVHPQADLHGMAEARGMDFTYLKELPHGQSVATPMVGFGDTPRDYDIRVENRTAGIGVRQTSDRSIAKLYFWSIRTTVCPEAFIDLKAEPGQEVRWRISYEFYTLPQ
ncbi:MAG TPA: hypothetical protein VKR61_04145 [Bryobacteraceae bacterium]|nr:hypothetical protein [Bryobacteraceae bacterium]